MLRLKDSAGRVEKGAPAPRKEGGSSDEPPNSSGTPWICVAKRCTVAGPLWVWQDIVESFLESLGFVIHSTRDSLVVTHIPEGWAHTHDGFWVKFYMVDRSELPLFSSYETSHVFISAYGYDTFRGIINQLVPQKGEGESDVRAIIA